MLRFFILIAALAFQIATAETPIDLDKAITLSDIRLMNAEFEKAKKIILDFEDYVKQVAGYRTNIHDYVRVPNKKNAIIDVSYSNEYPRRPLIENQKISLEDSFKKSLEDYKRNKFKIDKLFTKLQNLDEDNTLSLDTKKNLLKLVHQELTKATHVQFNLTAEKLCKNYIKRREGYQDNSHRIAIVFPYIEEIETAEKELFQLRETLILKTFLKKLPEKENNFKSFFNLLAPEIEFEKKVAPVAAFFPIEISEKYIIQKLGVAPEFIAEVRKVDSFEITILKDFDILLPKISTDSLAELLHNKRESFEDKDFVKAFIEQRRQNSHLSWEDYEIKVKEELSNKLSHWDNMGIDFLRVPRHFKDHNFSVAYFVNEKQVLAYTSQEKGYRFIQNDNHRFRNALPKKFTSEYHLFLRTEDILYTIKKSSSDINIIDLVLLNNIKPSVTLFLEDLNLRNVNISEISNLLMPLYYQKKKNADWWNAAEKFFNTVSTDNIQIILRELDNTDWHQHPELTLLKEILIDQKTESNYSEVMLQLQEELDRFPKVKVWLRQHLLQNSSAAFLTNSLRMNPEKALSFISEVGIKATSNQLAELLAPYTYSQLLTLRARLTNNPNLASFGDCSKTENLANTIAIAIDLALGKKIAIEEYSNFKTSEFLSRLAENSKNFHPPLKDLSRMTSFSYFNKKVSVDKKDVKVLLETLEIKNVSTFLHNSFEFGNEEDRKFACKLAFALSFEKNYVRWLPLNPAPYLKDSTPVALQLGTTEEEALNALDLFHRLRVKDPLYVDFDSFTMPQDSFTEKEGIAWLSPAGPIGHPNRQYLESK
jgi:hypothetical protein